MLETLSLCCKKFKVMAVTSSRDGITVSAYKLSLVEFLRNLLEVVDFHKKVEIKHYFQVVQKI
jgi:hypothetical protein